MESEPRVKLGWIGGGVPVAVQVVAVGLIWALSAGLPGLRPAAWGGLAGGFGVVLFPVVLGIVGRAPVSTFSVAVFASTMGHLTFAGGATVLGSGLVGGAGFEELVEGTSPERVFQAGAIGSALLGLTSQTLVAVAALRPTWDISDSASPLGSGGGSAEPNGPTTRPR